MKISIHKRLVKEMFISTLFLITQSWKKTQTPIRIKHKEIRLYSYNGILLLNKNVSSGMPGWLSWLSISDSGHDFRVLGLSPTPTPPAPFLLSPELSLLFLLPLPLPLLIHSLSLSIKSFKKYQPLTQHRWISKTLHERSQTHKKHILLYDSIYVKSKTRQNKSMVSEIQSWNWLLPLEESGWEKWLEKWWHERTFYSDKNVFYLILVKLQCIKWLELLELDA